jgi:cell division septum initiation protein DivIVA
MEGSPQLFSHVKFEEAKKGYDRDQVDNFLKELGGKIAELQDMLREATQRAEVAEAKATEATKAKATAESAAEAARAEAREARDAADKAPAAPEPVNEIEAASGVLALAQKTAEAAIAEAEAKGKDAIADARAKAAMMIVEVEQEVERIKTQAEADADALVAEKAKDVEAEVERLTTVRAGLQAEVDMLQQHVEEHRRRLRDGVDALRKALDDTEIDLDPHDGGGGPGSGSRPETDLTDAPAEPAAPLVGAASSTAPELPRIEFVPEPENAASPTAAAFEAPAPTISERMTLIRTIIDPDASDDDVPSEPHPSAELTIVRSDHEVVVGDSSVADDDAAFAPPAERPAPDPAEAERRAVQITSLLEGPQGATVEPPAVTAEPEPVAEVAPEPEPVHVAVEPAPVDIDLTAPSAPAAGAVAEADEPAPEPVEQAAAPVATTIDAAAPLTIAATGTDGPTGGRLTATAEQPAISRPAPSLFSDPSDGQPTQAYDVLADSAPAPKLTLQRSDPLFPIADESPLGEPDAEADAAMKAFFENDLDSLKSKDSKESKGRFLRRK